MKRTDEPKKQPVPFATNGPRENLLISTPAGDNHASYDVGFPAVTMILKAAGGLPPKGQDMNQILYELSSLARWASSGALNSFDPSFGSAIAGYPQGAALSNSTFTGCWLNTIDGNTNNPENTDGTLTGWIPAFSYGETTLTGLASANVTLTALQAANERIILTGALTANINLIFPAWRKNWVIVNNCTGAFSVTCKTLSGTGVPVSAGSTARVVGDGANISSSDLDDVIRKSDTNVQLPGQLTTKGDIKSTDGDLYSGDARLAHDGNIFGTVWGDSLFAYINRMRNTASLGESGWHRDAATGTIRQWGRTPAFGAGAGFLINFPIPFPTKIVSVNGILIRPGNTSTGSAETLYIGEPSSLTSVRMYHGGSETYPALWEVEGY